MENSMEARVSAVIMTLKTRFIGIPHRRKSSLSLFLFF